MREVKTNLDQAIYIDTENRSVSSGMLNSIQEIKIDKDSANVEDMEENE